MSGRPQILLSYLWFCNNDTMLNLFSLASRSAHWRKKELVAVMAFFLVCSRLMVSRGFGRKAVIFDLGTPWRSIIVSFLDSFCNDQMINAK